MAKETVVKLTGGIGASFPNDAINGRFHFNGIVVEGIKPMLGRRVRVEMTKAELQGAVNMGAKYLLQNPRCGSTPKREEYDY